MGCATHNLRVEVQVYQRVGTSTRQRKCCRHDDHVGQVNVCGNGGVKQDENVSVGQVARQVRQWLYDAAAGSSRAYPLLANLLHRGVSRLLVQWPSAPRPLSSHPPPVS